MPLNLKVHLVENILDLKTIEQKPTRNGYGEGLVRAQKMQDQFFRKMSAEEKIRLMSRFYHFARSLQKLNFYGTRKASS